MNKLIQCSDATYDRVLDLSIPWHSRLFPNVQILRFGPANRIDRRIPYWDKVYWILKVLRESQDGDILLYMDCDVLALRTFDFKDVIGDYDFAGVKNINDIFNTGVLFIRVSSLTKIMFEHMENTGPLPWSPQEGDVINQYTTRLKCKTLSANWNYYSMAVNHNRNEAIMIQAWHGAGPEKTYREMDRIINVPKTAI